MDTYVLDPVGGFFITHKGFLDIGSTIGSMSIPTLFVLEGGYHLESIGNNVTAVLQGYQDAYPK